jgi:phosphatidylserine/phosphatidylglycerophosphate/cardiolipin synthase-like enzyme
VVRPYLSPTLVFLAFDWPDGDQHADFLGFAIQRQPGHKAGGAPDFLFNKLGFTKPTKHSLPQPSDKAPIQKFHWWDSGISDTDRGKKFTYTVIPVLGSGPNDLHPQTALGGSVTVTIPRLGVGQVATYFNRAVVSSQGFRNAFPTPQAELDRAMAWLANGLQDAIPRAINGAERFASAIYHLTDNEFVMPDLEGFPGGASIAYFLKGTTDDTNLAAVDILEKARPKFALAERTKTNLMHDKFIVSFKAGQPVSVMTGSANFTPEGLTTQANLLHVFDSPELAKLYAARQKKLAANVATSELAKTADWSDTIRIGPAKVRVFFAPEKKPNRKSIDAVVEAVKKAKSSVIFCLFDATDPDLIAALLAAADKGKILFGLVNAITDPAKKKKAATMDEAMQDLSPSAEAQVKVFEASRTKRPRVVKWSMFTKQTAPAGFLPELSTIDLSSKSTTGAKPPATVHIHHKFIVIDAETSSPTIYSGSANFSANSTWRNDEALVEVKGDTATAQLYLAEFLRLYDHFYARAVWDQNHPSNAPATAHEALLLAKSRDKWVKDAYKAGTNDFHLRTALAAPLTAPAVPAPPPKPARRRGRATP